MNDLGGINTKELNLPIEKYIGTLLYEEIPTTLIFIDDDNNPIVREWVDCSEDGKIDRYFYFKTDVYWLKRFIEAEISHQDFILNAIDGFAYFQDKMKETVINNSILAINQLPNDYRSSSEFFLNKNDAIDLQQICEYFNLEKVETLISISDYVKNIANIKQSETLNLHLHHGNGVGFGTINTETLAKTLLKFDKFYKEVALDLYEGSNRGSITINAAKKQGLNEFISTEVYGNIAASYSVLIRPKAAQFNLFEEKTPTEKIADKIFSLIFNSTQIEPLEGEYVKHSDFTINSYKDFLKNVYELQLEIELNWFNPSNKEEHNIDIDYRSANKIIDNIENLNIESEDEFSIKGKFRSINCDTGHYTFITTDNEQFNGYFDKLIKDASEQITFISIYDVSINRKMIKEPGRVDAKLFDTIIAFYLES